MDDEELDGSPERRAPLVATWSRCAAATGLVSGAVVLAVQTWLVATHASRTIAGAWPVILGGVALLAVVLWATLRAEEARLARELRIARTGTTVLRAMASQRRQKLPAVARWLSTRLGMAAVLLAEDDRPGALAALAGGSFLMRGGRLEPLRAMVEADAERATGTPASVTACIQRLLAMPRVGNREADLYRTHVLVKAVLELGDADRALTLLPLLESSGDGEERVYLAWLRVWFELDADADGGPRQPLRSPLSAGELRLAALLARAHGAEKLVEKLEARLGGIARETAGE